MTEQNSSNIFYTWLNESLRSLSKMAEESVNDVNYIKEYNLKILKEMGKQKRILYSGLRTPDGTIIESNHRHDYKTHVDKNGKTYMIDGGHDYIRCSANGDEEFITITANNKHKKIREFFKWGTYGKNGSEELTYVKLKDMEKDHIKKCLGLTYVDKSIKFIMSNELLFRRKLQ